MTIRRIPDDFVVREVLTEAYRSRIRLAPAHAAIALYELEKRSLTTPDACFCLAKAVGVKSGMVESAGLKDRHARTWQHVTVRFSDASRAAVAPGRVDGSLGGGVSAWSAVRAGWVDGPIAATAIDRNRFEIVVRDLSRDSSAEMDRRAGALIRQEGVDAGALLVVNYFGDQRFGSARHGEGWAAKHLIRGEFEQAVRLLIGTPARKDSGRKRTFTRVLAARWGEWSSLATDLPPCPERRAIEVLARGGAFREAFDALPNFTKTMAIEAYQSFLWNATARRLVTMLGANENGSLLHAADDFGEMLFPQARQVDRAWREVDVPMLEPEAVLHAPAADAARTVMAEEGIGLEDLRVPGLRRPAFGAAARSLFMSAAAFELGGAEPDDLGGGKRLKRRVNFDLPRGAYATVVLRALGQ